MAAASKLTIRRRWPRMYTLALLCSCSSLGVLPSRLSNAETRGDWISRIHAAAGISLVRFALLAKPVMCAALAADSSRASISAFCVGLRLSALCHYCLSSHARRSHGVRVCLSQLSRRASHPVQRVYVAGARAAGQNRISGTMEMTAHHSALPFSAKLANECRLRAAFPPSADISHIQLRREASKRFCCLRVSRDNELANRRKLLLVLIFASTREEDNH